MRIFMDDAGNQAMRGGLDWKGRLRSSSSIPLGHLPPDKVAPSHVQPGLECQNVMGKQMRGRDAAFETTCTTIPVRIPGHPGWF